MKYDADFGDGNKCVCGHTYSRHFDSYEDMAPVGCKYCACMKFDWISHDPESFMGNSWLTRLANGISIVVDGKPYLDKKHLRKQGDQIREFLETGESVELWWCSKHYSRCSDPEPHLGHDQPHCNEWWRHDSLTNSNCDISAGFLIIPKKGKS